MKDCSNNFQQSSNLVTSTEESKKSTSYVPQPSPPTQIHPTSLNLNGKGLSQVSPTSSGYHSSTTFRSQISTIKETEVLLQLDPNITYDSEDVEENSSSAVYNLPPTQNMKIVCSNPLFRTNSISTSSITSSNYSYNSRSTMDLQNTVCCESGPNQSDLNSVVFTYSSSDDISATKEANLVMLTFPSLSSSDHDDSSESESDYDNSNYSQEHQNNQLNESLTELNLTINPCHFDPL